MKKVAILIMIMFSTCLFAADKKMNISDLDSSKSEKVIIDTAKWAGQEKEEKAVPNLIKLLADKRDMVRLEAVKALGYIGEEDSVDELHKVLLGDSNSTVRYAALLSTMRIGSKKSLKVWEKAKMTETDPFMVDLLKKMEEKAKGK